MTCDTDEPCGVRKLAPALKSGGEHPSENTKEETGNGIPTTPIKSRLRQNI